MKRSIKANPGYILPARCEPLRKLTPPGSSNRAMSDELAQKPTPKTPANAGLGGRGLASEMPAKGSTLLSRAAATASLFLVVMLVLVPCAALFVALNPLSISGTSHMWLFQLPAIYGAVWALISLWAALNSSKLLLALGMPADPLGSYGVWGLLLGALNIGASLLIVTLRISR
jgi:hypothetical protein